MPSKIERVKSHGEAIEERQNESPNKLSGIGAIEETKPSCYRLISDCKIQSLIT
jgi:hypothetical protein